MAYSCDVLHESGSGFSSVGRAFLIATLLMSAVGVDSTRGTIYSRISESAEAVDHYNSTKTFRLSDSADAVDHFNAQARMFGRISESARGRSDCSFFGYGFTSESGIGASAPVRGFITAKLSDSGEVVDAFSSQSQRFGASHESARGTDHFRGLTFFRLSDSVEAVDAYRGTIHVNAVFHESAVAVDEFRSRSTRFGRLSDSAQASDSYGVHLVAYGFIHESAVGASGVINPLSGLAWTAPTDTFAMSRFTGYRFNSAAVIGGRLIAADDGGLYLLTGDDDAGTPVVARLTTGLSDVGDPQQKRVREVFVGYEADGTLAMKVSGTGTGAEVGYTYTLPAKTADDTIANRVKIGRGMRSRFWRFEFSNPSGEPFKATETRVAIDTLSRKV